MQKNISEKISNTEYEDLITKTIASNDKKEKSIVKGKIIAIENDVVIIDVGLKSEGRVPLTEFARPGQKPEITIGEDLDVFVENVDSANGETKLSREKAVKQGAWNNLQYCFDENKTVTGIPFNRVKGGMSVDLDGVTAFLPGSQIDTRQIIKDTKELLNKPLDLMILKMDKFRGNIVVSRKAISDVELKEQRNELLSSISEGSVLEGKVKNLTDYGAFVDLGGIDGLIHVTDLSWKKVNHPSEVLDLGSTIKVKILKFDQELTRLSLGVKQLTDDPWLEVNNFFEADKVVNCPISSVSDQGVSLLIDERFEGFIPLSELSWLKKPPHPSKILDQTKSVEVKILEADNEKRRIICSLKQLKDNPWDTISKKFNVGEDFETEVVNVVDFGIFVKVYEEIDGMVHVSDLDWNEDESTKMLADFKKGDSLKVKILEINTEKERISLGIKHLKDDPIESFISKHKNKSKVSGKIISIDDKGIYVSLDNDMKGFIKKANLSIDRNEQRTDRFAIDEMVDAMIMSIENKNRLLNLSIKQIEIDEEKNALTKYGSSDSGASLGDILGSVLKKKKDD